MLISYTHCIRDSQLLLTPDTQYKLEILAFAPRQYASTPRRANKSPENDYKNSNQKNGSLTVRMRQATLANFKANIIMLEE